MKEAGKIRRNIRTTVWCMLLAGIMGIFGNGISAEAEEYGQLIKSGTCGAEGNESGVTWAVYDSGAAEDANVKTGDTLVLGGRGKMMDWVIAYGSETPPWMGYNKKLKTVIFKDGNQITGIGALAFSGCSGLSSINIPSGVTSIGASAFSGCSGLSSINIPSGVTSIGASAFSGCSGLSSVSIPSGVTGIEASTFKSCSELSSVSIPSGVTGIGDQAFNGCVCLTNINIPAGVTSIGEFAFNGCSNLKSVSIPSGVTSIEEHVFNNCAGLTSVNISSRVTSIGNGAFHGCTSLTSISIPAGVTNIHEQAFGKCKKLTIDVEPLNTAYCSEEGILYSKDKSVLISAPKANGNFVIPTHVTAIGDYAFQYCSGLNDVSIPLGVTVIGNYAFYECSGLSNISIPSTVMNIGKYAFYYCGSLTSVSIPLGVTSIEEATFFYCSKLIDVSIPSTVTNIGSSAFHGCKALTGITIPAGVTSIEGYVFSGCSGLENINIPAGVTCIGVFAFAGCSGLENINIPAGVTYIGTSAFKDCSELDSVNIPSGVTNIDYNTFMNCSSLSSVVIPATVTSIGSSAFDGCNNMQEIYYSNNVSVDFAKIPNTSLQMIYEVNEDDTVSLVVKYIPENTTNILLPEKIDGKTVSSLSLGNSTDNSKISITCTKHYTVIGGFGKEEHWYTNCGICGSSVKTNETHKFVDGNQACECGYVPFVIDTQPQGKTWSYGSVSDEERKVSVEVTATVGDEDIAYQWYDNGNLVAGATESTYKITEEIKSHNCYCVISSGGYSINSDTVTVSVSKAQGMINVEEGKETVVIEYSKIPVLLDWVTKTGDGTLLYTITEGEDVLSVSADGKITMAKPGEATISINMAETENYKQAETKNITVKVMTHYPATTPDTPLAVANTVKKVSDVSLPEHWEWESEDGKKTLSVGKNMEVTANYIGTDKEFYYNTSIKVIIQRAACTDSDILYTGEGEKAPTCTEEGKGHRECTVCGDILESNITVPVIKHTLSKVPGVEAGCTTDGTEVHWSCQVCKKLFADDQGSKEVSENELVIDALGHKGGQADCSKKAVCEVCKKEYGELNKSKHGESEVKNAKKATCTEKGYTGDNCCKDCGEKVSSGKEIPLLGHTGGQADCSKKAVCTVCKKEYGELNKSKHGETEVKNAKKATCTEKGYTGDNCCKGCGEKISSGTEIPLSQHQLSKAENREATCTTDGQTEHWSCLVCEKMFSDKEGNNEITKDFVVIPAKGHIGTVATCQKKGYCIICEMEYGELDKNNHGEKEVKGKKEATCKEEGYTGDVCCKDCGERISKGETIEKTAHIWDGGIITKEATETEKGIRTYTCSICQETKIEEIPATGKVVTPEKPGEVITPEIPEKVTPTPTVKPTVTQKPTEKPSKEEQKEPKKGAIVTDKRSNGKYKVLTAGKNGTVEYVSPLNKKATKANIPATVKINGITYKVVSIAKNAFKNNKYITKVTIGKNVKTIGANAFYGCKKLKTVSMGKNITSIGDKAFYKCTALTKITIPSKVKKIGKQTFYGCKKLKTITLKTTKLTKKNVGSKAFGGIYKKATIKVPKSKVKAYQKLLKTKGISKTVKVKK